MTKIEGRMTLQVYNQHFREIGALKCQKDLLRDGFWAFMTDLFDGWVLAEGYDNSGHPVVVWNGPWLSRHPDDAKRLQAAYYGVLDQNRRQNEAGGYR